MMNKHFYPLFLIFLIIFIFILKDTIKPTSVYAFSCFYCGESWDCDDTWAKCGTNGIQQPGCSTAGTCSDACCAGSGSNSQPANPSIENPTPIYIPPVPTYTPIPTPTPTPTPDLRFQFKFMGVKLGEIQSKQEKKLHVQGYLDPTCVNEYKPYLNDQPLDNLSTKCSFLYDTKSPENPLVGFKDFYNLYEQFKGFTNQLLGIFY